MPSVPLRPYALQYVLDKLVEQANESGRLKAALAEAELRLSQASAAIEQTTRHCLRLEEKLKQQQEAKQ